MLPTTTKTKINRKATEAAVTAPPQSPPPPSHDTDTATVANNHSKAAHKKYRGKSGSAEDSASHSNSPSKPQAASANTGDDKEPDAPADCPGDEENKVLSGSSTPKGKGASPDLRHVAKNTKGAAKSWSPAPVSEGRPRREGKVSQSAPPELKRTTSLERRGTRSALAANFHRSGRSVTCDVSGKKNGGGLKKRSHSPSNREPGRSLKTRKSRSHVTSPEPLLGSDVFEKNKPERNTRDGSRKKASQTHITEYYTICKEKSTYKVIRTLPNDPPSEKSATLRSWNDEHKRVGGSGGVASRHT